MDEILQRIESCGLLDGNLARYNPDIVRLSGMTKQAGGGTQQTLDRQVDAYMQYSMGML